MSIRSVDLQVLFSKQSDIEKAQQQQQQQDKTTTSQIAQEVSAKRIEEQRQVVKTPRSEHGKIEDRPDRRQGGRQGKKKDGEDAGEEGGDKRKKSIDIRI